MGRVDEIEADRAVSERVAGLECAVAQRLSLRVCIDRARRNAREIVGDADHEAASLRREVSVETEAIPFDETRGYTKRVLASFFAYSWLYSPRPVPALALAPLRE